MRMAPVGVPVSWWLPGVSLAWCGSETAMMLVGLAFSSGLAMAMAMEIGGAVDEAVKGKEGRAGEIAV